jgi:mannosyl-3-phosphoglycerate phosphatase
MNSPLLIFTDIDGTLLDHHSYSYQGSEKVLEQLRRVAIPLILNSSKTKAELLKLQAILGLNGPFIAENGGGIFLPAGLTLPESVRFENSGSLQGMKFGMEYSQIRAIFVAVRGKYKIRGFGDMTAEEIMAATGLSREDAILAGQRDFSEPFLFQAEPRPQELQEEVAARGLTVTRGGRFYHLLASGQDKGRAVLETTRLFQGGCQDRITTVGLGDAANDYPMLRVVDIPVLVPKPDGGFENMDLPGLRKAPYPGSRGWAAAITGILHELQLSPSPTAGGCRLPG